MISKTTAGLRIFQLLGSLKVTNAGCTRGIRSRIAMVHASFKNKKPPFNSKFGRISGRKEQNATLGPYLCMSLKLGLFEK
jgi:hypothetical protein